MSWANALAKYAAQDPASIDADVLVTSNNSFMTIKDAYPKSIYHYLILPRIPSRTPNVPASSLDSLSAFLRLPKEQALVLLDGLEEAANEATVLIEERMRTQHGWKWPVEVGFHAVPSMQLLHLHVLSRDLISACLKNKKHYNSFHPDLGFFLHLDVIRSLVTNGEHVLPKRPDFYEAILKLPLRSFHTDEEFKSIPKLKMHLEETWRSKERKAVKG